jgi:hypothetical protein
MEVGQSGGSVLLSGEDVDSTPPQAAHNRQRDVDVRIEAQDSCISAVRSQSALERRRRCLSTQSSETLGLELDVRVHLGLVVIVPGQSGVDLCQREIRMVLLNRFGVPPVAEMVEHDLRSTFVTLALANGKTEAWVMDRTGHTASAMLNRYRRAARFAQELELGGLLPLDEAIPELKPATSSPTDYPARNGDGQQVSETTGGKSGGGAGNRTWLAASSAISVEIG